VLQFENVAQRLATEYKVDAIYDAASISTARWLTYPDEATRRDFEREQTAALATDVDGNPVFLATNKYNLQVTQERWPKVGFHTTREHGQRLQFPLSPQAGARAGFREACFAPPEPAGSAMPAVGAERGRGEGRIPEKVSPHDTAASRCPPHVGNLILVNSNVSL
jgi:hypothetical protein